MKKVLFRPEISSVAILIIMFGITAVLQSNFFDPGSLVRTLNAFTPLILIAMGQAVVIIAGGIDLSAGSSLSLLTCVMVSVMNKDQPETGIYAILLAVVVAVAIGLINGIGIGYLRLPPVVITFATSYIWLGIALFLRPTPGGHSVPWFKVFYNASGVEGAPGFLVFIPPALILLLIGCVGWYLFSRTRTARYIYAVGGNNNAAFASGIKTARIQTIACIINALFILLAALFFVGQNQSADARIGDPFTLKCIAAVVVGGVALTGGRGSVFSALVGALILSFVSKIIFFADIPNAWQTFVSGAIVIAAIVFSLIYTLYSKRRSLGEARL